MTRRKSVKWIRSIRKAHFNPISAKLNFLNRSFIALQTFCRHVEQSLRNKIKFKKITKKAFKSLCNKLVWSFPRKWKFYFQALVLLFCFQFTSTWKGNLSKESTTSFHSKVFKARQRMLQCKWKSDMVKINTERVVYSRAFTSHLAMEIKFHEALVALLFFAFRVTEITRKT